MPSICASPAACGSCRTPSPLLLPNRRDVPLMLETVPGFTATGWFALMAPPGTPKEIAQKVSDDLNRVLARPDVQRRFQDLGTYTPPMSPETGRIYPQTATTMEAAAWIGQNEQKSN